MKKILILIGVLTVIGIGVLLLTGTTQKTNTATNKISIVTTLFPQYDFAKKIGGDKVDVTLLLPPGVEPHAYEPKPSDIAKINNAKIFIYTGKFMEPWAYDVIKGANKTIKVVDTSNGIDLIKADPHIWLDFDNAKKMAENIATSLIAIDLQNENYYKNNLKLHLATLSQLDDRFKKTLSACKSKTIIYGGHYTFGYLAKRYSLEYKSAQGFSPDAEPTAKDMIALVDQIKKNDIKYIFYEELTSSKIAETLAHETNAKLLLLNGAHNLPKENFEAGISFVSIMDKNLKNLQLGLGCR